MVDLPAARFRDGAVPREERCPASADDANIARVHGLHDMPSPYAARVQPARDVAAWTPHCKAAHDAQWIAWNVCQDGWYRPQDFKRLQDAIDREDPSLHGAELLRRCAPSLQHIRDLSPAEQALLPSLGVNHVKANGLQGAYDLTPASAWKVGGLAGETNPPPIATGTTLRVVPKPTRRWKWVTFEANGVPVPRAAEEIARRLGLGWGPADGVVARVEIPMDTLRKAGALFVLPTLFDQLGDNPKYGLWTDWRARPKHEQSAGEPWGFARDMQHDGPALPELILDIAKAGEMNAKCLDAPATDWASRPYLQRSAPR